MNVFTKTFIGLFHLVLYHGFMVLSRGFTEIPEIFALLHPFLSTFTKENSKSANGKFYHSRFHWHSFHRLKLLRPEQGMINTISATTHEEYGKCGESHL